LILQQLLQADPRAHRLSSLDPNHDPAPGVALCDRELYQGPALVFPAAVSCGIVIGGIEIILNLEADRTEHMVGYRIMNRAHAFWRRR
jgi:hypothetical protein